MSDDLSQMKQRADAVQTRIQNACQSCNRNPNDVTLIWVSKTKPRSAVDLALKAGGLHFGENRIQECIEKFSTPSPKEILHVIGPVQKNKLRKAASVAKWIHTLSDLASLQKLNTICSELNKQINVLIQINISGEESKSGVPLQEASEFLNTLPAFSHLNLCGLMGIGPNTHNPEDARFGFKSLKELQTQFENSKPQFEHFNQLSMGMSSDLEIAIEEGATFIRIGTALFGARDYSI